MGYLGIQSPQTQAWLLAGALLMAAISAVFLLTAFIIWLVFRRARPLWKFLGSIMGSVGSALSGNPDLQNLARNHPLISSFLRARFRRDTFTGWPVTLLSLSLLYSLLLFLGSVEDFVTSDVITAADNRIANILYVFRSPPMTEFFLWITLLGKWQVVIVFATAVSFFLLIRGRSSHTAGLWLALSGGFLFSSLGKLAFHRPRPQVALYLEPTWSFPSGHATVAVALYGFLVFLLWRLGRGWSARILGSAGLIMVIALTGFSRLYLGVHYLSDVWSGYLLGLVWVIMGVSLAEAAAFHFHEAGTFLERVQPYRKPASWFLLAVALAFYMATGITYNPARTPPLTVEPDLISGDVLSRFGEGKLSPYSETIIGTSQEPISFIVHVSDPGQLMETFSAAGWSLAQPGGIGTLVLAGRAALLNEPDTTAPMTPSLWEGKPHDFGFQKPVPGQGLRQRHHARFWITPLISPDQRLYLVGTASLDVGMKWIITHRIAPDIDTERQFLFNDLVATGRVRSWEKRPMVGPTMGTNFARDPFFTDGQVYVLDLP